MESSPVVPHVLAGGKCFVTLRAGEAPYVVVYGVHVCGEPALLGEVLSTELTADLSTDAVSSEVIAERVSVAVALLADVADQLLCVVCQHVHAEGRLVHKLLPGIRVHSHHCMLAQHGVQF